MAVFTHTHTPDFHILFHTHTSTQILTLASIVKNGKMMIRDNYGLMVIEQQERRMGKKKIIIFYVLFLLIIILTIHTYVYDII